jgi:hypothetical protein
VSDEGATKYAMKDEDMRYDDERKTNLASARAERSLRPALPDCLPTCDADRATAIRGWVLLLF